MQPLRYVEPRERHHQSHPFRTVVVDTTDPRRPTETSYLSTTSMLDPWASLKVHTERQLLLGENGINAAGGPQPCGVTTPSYGSQHFNPDAFLKSGTPAGDPDWRSAQLRLDARRRTLETTCQDNGFLSLKFEHGV